MSEEDVTVKGRTIQYASIQRCPKKSFSPGHYLDDGTCRCARPKEVQPQTKPFEP